MASSAAPVRAKPTTGDGSSPSSSPSRLHVTPQVITLGRVEDDFYAAHGNDDDEHEHGSCRAVPETGSSSSAWYTRILPKNPFASSSTADEPREGAHEPSSSGISDATDSYRSLGGGGGEGDPKREGSSSPSDKRSTAARKDPGLDPRRYIPSRNVSQRRPSHAADLAQPILPPTTTAQVGRDAATYKPIRAASVEEEIARNSFFFREEGASLQGQTRGRSMLAHKQWRRQSGRRQQRGSDGLELPSAPPFASSSSSSTSPSFRTLLYDPDRTSELGYRDLSSVHVSLAPPVLSRFRAKYELLNQPISRPSRGRRATSTRLYHFYNLDGVDEHDDENCNDDDDDDLSEGGNDFYVSENDNVAGGGGGYDLELCENTGPLSKARRTDSASLSSLLYRNDRGRVALRLPSDQVRLVMDPDLQPGILSVEQWRKCEQEYSDEATRPTLLYVLTVQEDLYRKILGELSDSVTNPYCGVSKCCSEKEFVDIRVAVVIVGFMLSVLLLLTFVWPVS
jgi:hypothetical protein